ncbi:MULTISPECIES: glycosyltransferase [Thermoactinomyces]|jgi:hypothetical protein|uniref:Glycosyltransferase n=1 Tax=Thermoactinomyces daqus TaxID=1329516 RepID=A0A7W1XBT4_9BACL|nr:MULTISPECIES: hypothetical protein [Thermoactinomyces]MBA4543769.1 hypothetical protein [Thermoactinomyces daqus]MBH8598392.1 hypothetical protein [Thermoactinomyces sp. CICC 10523]MBH8604517.1 hypothetical protein [Thermoactinomyces sp. CICC 10522]
MEEAKQTVLILLSSIAPSFQPARFPVIPPSGDKTVHFSVHTAEEMAMRFRESEAGCFHLHNPPESVLQLCREQSSPVTISFDRLPARKVFPLLKLYEVQVPSLSFGTIFRRNGVQAKVVHPLPRAMQRGKTGRKAARKLLRTGERLCVWVDENLVPASFRLSLFQALQAALKENGRFKAIWVTDRTSFAKNRIVSVHSGRVKEKALWLAADLLLTVGGFGQSLAPLHIQSLYQRIPVMTDDTGDHGEWVKHLHSGILLDKKNIFRELRHYFCQLARNPGLLEQFRQNGHDLVQKTIGAKWDASTKTDREYHYSEQR